MTCWNVSTWAPKRLAGVAKVPMLLDAGVATKRASQPFSGAARQGQRRRGDQQRDRYRERIAETDIRRYALAAADSAFEHAAREPRQARAFHAVMIDDRGDAGVGRAQHRPRGLERAHGGDLIVLLGRQRVS